MLIEKFITSYMRRKNSDYLKFEPDALLSLPERRHDAPPMLMYIHIPFCEQLCPYCSFNRVVFREELARRYYNALRKEIVMYRDLGYDFSAIYVGGGTPTVLIDELTKTLSLCRDLFGIREVSVETNPNHLTVENIKRLRDAGVNRLSVGVQSFDDTLLKMMERYHKYGSGEEIARRLTFVQGTFDTLNVDMIFNFPAQTMESLERDLKTLVDLSVDQVTYYPLMVSSSTQEVVSRRLGEVDYERGMAYYMKIVETLEQRYRPSTAWCFSKKEGMIDEYVVNYEEYAGFGSGSIGYLSGIVYSNTFDIEDYIFRVEKGDLPITAKKDCNSKERFRYDFLMKLFGLNIDLDELKRKNGVSPYRYLWLEILFFWFAGGLHREGRSLVLTKKGQYYWVLMMREFFTAVNNFRDYCRTLIEQKKSR